MKFLFLVQGEGRGHMAQALSLKKRLEEKGHEVSTGIGVNPRRKIPGFFSGEFGSRLFEYQSPNFVLDKREKGLQIGRTLFKNLLHFQKYLKQLGKFRREIEHFRPDAIINFFEPLFGLFYLIHKTKIPVYGIAHQFLFLHPDFKKPRGKKWDMLSMEYLTRITAYGCRRIFALSFYDLPEKGKIMVTPPILRDALFNLHPASEEFFLAYLLNPGYLEEVRSWSAKNPGIKIRCFTDSLPEETHQAISSDLSIYGLSGTKFLDFLSKCRGLATSSGFESVCEAMYFEKPVLMVPVKNHFEQFVNSRDGQNAGAGIFSDRFDFDILATWSKKHKPHASGYKKWVDDNQNKMLNYIYSDLIKKNNLK
jgi:uncharacterized protein (TIGR00661 family)